MKRYILTRSFDGSGMTWQVNRRHPTFWWNAIRRWFRVKRMHYRYELKTFLEAVEIRWR